MNVQNLCRTNKFGERRFPTASANANVLTSTSYERIRLSCESNNGSLVNIDESKCSVVGS